MGSKIKKKFLAEKKQMALGMAETKLSLLTFQQYFISKLVKLGIPAISISPSSLLRMYNPTEDYLDQIDDEEKHEAAVAEDKDLQMKMFVAQISKMVNRGIIPVLHGDVVVDDGQGVNVLSGDVIVEMLCNIFKNHPTFTPIVYFVTDVSGVYLHVPSDEEEISGKGLIREMRLVQSIESSKQKHYTMVFHMYHEEEEEQLKKGSKKLTPQFSLVHQHDVTGGLEEKIRNALTIVRNDANVHVYIIKCGTNDARLIMTRGYMPLETTRGTHIHSSTK